MGDSLGASGWPNVITREGPKEARGEKAVGQGKVLFFGKVSLDDVFAERAWGKGQCSRQRSLKQLQGCHYHGPRAGGYCQGPQHSRHLREAADSAGSAGDHTEDGTAVAFIGV